MIKIHAESKNQEEFASQLSKILITKNRCQPYISIGVRYTDRNLNHEKIRNSLSK
jgi:hypothetical protein